MLTVRILNVLIARIWGIRGTDTGKTWMIDDIIAEVCSEITLLSAFASHIEHADTATLERDVTILFSGLSLLAAHAQKLKSGDTGGYWVGCKRLLQHTAPHEEPQHKVLQRTESGPNSPHKWVLEVLQDLTTYTRTNDLHSLAETLENIGDRYHDYFSENVPVDSVIDCVGSNNIVAFAPYRRSKVSGEHAPQ